MAETTQSMMICVEGAHSTVVKSELSRSLQSLVHVCLCHRSFPSATESPRDVWEWCQSFWLTQDTFHSSSSLLVLLFAFFFSPPVICWAFLSVLIPERGRKELWGEQVCFFFFFLFFVPASASHTSAAVRRTEIQALNLRNFEY